MLETYGIKHKHKNSMHYTKKMEWFRGGKRKNGGGIREAQVGEFVMGGGVGAMVGGMAAMHLSHDLPMAQGMLATSVGIGIGHVVGHEMARRNMDGPAPAAPLQ